MTGRIPGRTGAGCDLPERTPQVVCAINLDQAAQSCTSPSPLRLASSSSRVPQIIWQSGTARAWTGLVHVGVAGIEVMVELPPLGRVDFQFPQVSRGHPAHVAGLVVDGRSPPTGSASSISSYSCRISPSP